MKSINYGKTGEIYHFSPTQFFKIRDIVKIICEVLNVPYSELVEISEDRLGKDNAYLMNSEKSRSELNWSDKTNLKTGIDQTISWIRNNLDEIKSLPHNYIHKI
jgi:dTDP-glucose 4,6-dehydratase